MREIRAVICLYITTLIGCFFVSISSLKATIFGASGGVGQQVAATLLQKGINVNAVGRNAAKLSSISLLEGAQKTSVDLNNQKSVINAVVGSDYVIISVGTTAFPTKAWDGGNNPRVACFESVEKVLDGIQTAKMKPKKVLLVSSIGVERSDQFPFKILNSYGVLTEKLRSEQSLSTRCLAMGIAPIICRPGRLIGPPFTNFDLARLLKIERAADRAVTLSPLDDLKGDVDRRDVATSILRFLTDSRIGGRSGKDKAATVYSIVNAAGPSPSEEQWTDLLQPYSNVPAKKSSSLFAWK